MGTNQFRWVLTHPYPHIDEVAALFMAEKVGESKFPGLSEAQLMFCNVLGNDSDGKPMTGDQAEEFGYLALGIGGGRFDEHPANGGVRKEGECVTTLMAKYLKVLEVHPEWEAIIEYVKNNDLNGAKNRFDVATTMIHMYKDEKPEDVIEWAKLALKAWFRDERCRLKTEEILESTIAALSDKNDPAILPAKEYVEKSNNRRIEFRFDIATATRLIRRWEGEITAAEWALKGLAAWANQQRRYLVAVLEFHKTAELVECAPGLHIACIESDSSEMSKVFRSSDVSKSIAILIQCRSTGNVQIFSDHALVSKARMDDLAKTIRLFEQNMKKKMVTTDWVELTKEGKDIPGVDEWYYHPILQAMLNGSLTAPNVPPTKLPLEEIVKAARMVLDDEYFPSDREEKCLKGVCTSTSQDLCPWYPLGLGKCRRIRYAMKNPK